MLKPEQAKGRKPGAKPGKQSSKSDSPLYKGASVSRGLVSEPITTLEYSGKVQKTGTKFAAHQIRATSMKRGGEIEDWRAFREAFVTESSLDQIEHIRIGVNAPLLVGAAADLQISQETLFSVVHLPVTTAKRKVSRNELLDPGVTERLARIAQIVQFAAEVFGTDKKATQWLSANNLALGNTTPLSLLDTEIGGREVERILHAIRYGMAA